MKKSFKFVFAILAMIFLAGNINVGSEKASQVEGKTEKQTVQIKVTILNETFEPNLQEIAYRIRNTADKDVKIKGVGIQINNNGKWVPMEKKEKISKKFSVGSGKTVYDSLNITRKYAVEKDGMAEGEYCLFVRYKYGQKVYSIRKVFQVSKERINEHETPNTEPESENVTTDVLDMISKGPNVTASKALILNTDFFIEKNGKATAMVFSEAEYKTTKKVKINLTIQKKIKHKWKKYKSYQIIKKSNIAFADKTLSIKQSGKYRMKVKVIFYNSKNRKKQYVTKSKTRIVK